MHIGAVIHNENIVCHIPEDVLQQPFRLILLRSSIMLVDDAVSVALLPRASPPDDTKSILENEPMNFRIKVNGLAAQVVQVESCNLPPHGMLFIDGSCKAG
jgi:hypothetical protein